PIVLNIADRSVRRDGPELDGVVMVDGIQPADLEQRLARRLHIAGFIRAAGCKTHRAAIPVPGKTKSRKSFAEPRFVDARILPRCTAIHRDFTLADAAGSRPCESGARVHSRAR